MKNSVLERLRHAAKNYPPVIKDNIEALTTLCVKEFGYQYDKSSYRMIENILLGNPQDMYDPVMAVEDYHGPLLVLIIKNDIIIGYDDGVNVFRYDTRNQRFISEYGHMEQESSLRWFCRVFPDYLYGETPYDS